MSAAYALLLILQMISLESYVENMKEGQEDIYFIGGENKESLLASPLIERLKKRGYDVLLFSNPMDEYVALHLGKFDGKYKLADVSKEGLKLDESDKEKQEEYKKEFEPLIDYLKETLKKQISNVEVSVRLSTSPCALVSASWGMSANLERIMKAQALADKNVRLYFFFLCFRGSEINNLVGYVQRWSQEGFGDQSSPPNHETTLSCRRERRAKRQH